MAFSDLNNLKIFHKKTVSSLVKRFIQVLKPAYTTCVNFSEEPEAFR